MSGDQEIDTQVAMKVMGWRWYSADGKNREGEKVFHFAGPDYEVPGHWKNVKHTDPATYKGKKHECDMGRPFYSTDIAAAFQVVEKCGLSLVRSADGWYAIKVQDIVHTCVHGTDHPAMHLIGREGEEFKAYPTMPLAVCQAALRSLA